MIDGYKLAQLHAVRMIGELIRRRWGLWCGFLLRGGAVVPVGVEHEAARLPLCGLLKGRGDQSGSCASSVRRWSDAACEGDIPAGSVTELRCHAGLMAFLRPVMVAGEPRVTFYASGFWRQGEAEEDERWVSRRLRELQIKGGDLGRVPRIGAEDRRLLGELIEAACREAERFAEAAQGQQVSAAPARYSDIIGQAQPILSLFKVLDKVATSESTVLIQGENGTGKELIARAIHFNSRRREQAFVVQNCSALNDNLLDSELFGHKKGAFTGAVTDKQGLFDIANGGTFFLDEVGDMSPTLQVKMLRVLQEGTFLPVGDTVVRKVDVRIIAATNRDLKTMVREGTFREDLYDRINVINLVVPSLRDRRADIPLLLDHFMSRARRQLQSGAKEIDEAAMARLMGYAWPGNIRELENEVERLVVLSGGDTVIREGLLSPRILGATPEPASLAEVPESDLPGALEGLEQRMLLEGLRRTGWNKTRTARELGISRRNLIRKVERYELDKLRER